MKTIPIKAITNEVHMNTERAINHLLTPVLTSHGHGSSAIQIASSTPRAYIVTATKELVDALLSMNTSNRKLRKTAVNRLAADIKADDWKLTASGVGVDRNGVLSDGQHRLVAIKEAGYPPIEFVLVVGLDPKAQAVVDRHAKRGLADALSLMHGRTISNTVIAVCNQLVLIKGALEPDTTFSYSGNQPSDGTTAATLLLWEDDINVIIGLAGTKIRSSVIAALAVYYRHDADLSMEFADQLKRGIGLDEYDPAYRLRSWLASSRAKQHGAQGGVSAFANTVTAIVAHSQGRKLKLLRPSESWNMAIWKRWMA